MSETLNLYPKADLALEPPPGSAEDFDFLMGKD